MNAKISAFVAWAEAIIYLLLYNLHDFIFKHRLEHVWTLFCHKMFDIDLFSSLKYKNPEKFKSMMLSKRSYQPQKLLINTFTIDESDEVELLGLTVDKQLNFDKHIDKLCRNTQIFKLWKNNSVGNAFIDSQFKYARHYYGCSAERNCIKNAKDSS